MSGKTSEISKIKLERPASPNDENEEEITSIAVVENEEEIEREEEEGRPRRKRIKREPTGYVHPRRFNPRWLTVPEVKNWVHGLKNDPAYIWCKFCKKKIRAHLTDMRVHNKTKKHQRNLFSARPEIPADFSPEFIPDRKNFLSNEEGNILITFPSQRDTSQEVIG
ncbi:hypothetical protein SK128_002981 [Halocaridina rubra]|uniref:Uncharacterized protein n=1 Tax=Halocaridina rubra TaxID=373956 RepID=A0AAN9A7J3_HALRR